MPKHRLNISIIKSKNLKKEVTDLNSSKIHLKEINFNFFAMNKRKL